MRRALAALALAVVLPLPGLAQVTVKPGETLGEIAERYGVSVNRLMQANGISDPTLVQIGQQLVIPGRGAASRSGGGSGGGGSARGGSYTVQSGETLGEIAERYGVSVNRLMQANGISDPTLLQAGTKIVVPGAAPARTTSRPSSRAQARNSKAREHVVQPGESLSEIADTYNLPVQKLVSLNNISDPNLLMSGTRLKLTAPPPVPASRPAPKPPKPAAAKPKAKPAAAASPTPAAPATAAVPKPVVAPAAKPAATTAPVTATSTAATPKPQAAKPVEAKPVETKPVETQPAGTKPQTTTAQVAARPTPRPASRPTTTTLAAKPAGPDWRTYGPLQVDWANWQPMGGSYVAPSLNAEGQPLYTAINCGARKLNATSQTGQWRTWEAPRTDAEQQLVSDLCKAKGG